MSSGTALVINEWRRRAIAMASEVRISHAHLRKLGVHALGDCVACADASRILSSSGPDPAPGGEGNPSTREE